MYRFQLVPVVCHSLFLLPPTPFAEKHNLPPSLLSLTCILPWQHLSVNKKKMKRNKYEIMTLHTWQDMLAARCSLLVHVLKQKPSSTSSQCNRKKFQRQRYCHIYKFSLPVSWLLILHYAPEIRLPIKEVSRIRKTERNSILSSRHRWLQVSGSSSH